MTAPRASIVVPTVGRHGSLLRLLAALTAQDAPPGAFEVVIVLDGADEESHEALARHPAPFPLRLHAQPRGGRAAACNAGARLGMGDVLIFLDDDMEPMSGFVAAHLAAHPDDGVVRGVVGAAPIVAPADAPPVTAFRAAGFARKLERLAAQAGGLAFTDVYTGNFSVPAAAFRGVGGYDEAFRLYGHEDYELALRLGAAGVRFVYDAAAVARQHYAKDFRSLAANVEAEGQTAVLFALKHPEVLPHLTLSRYAGRSRRTRRRLAALLAISRAVPGFPALLVRHVERLERRARRTGTPASARLFERYRLVFDLVYWIGVERALRASGVADGRVPFDAAGRLVAAAAGQRAGAGAPARAPVASSA